MATVTNKPQCEKIEKVKKVEPINLKFKITYEFTRSSEYFMDVNRDYSKPDNNFTGTTTKEFINWVENILCTEDGWIKTWSDYLYEHDLPIDTNPDEITIDVEVVK